MYKVMTKVIATSLAVLSLFAGAIVWAEDESSIDKEVETIERTSAKDEAWDEQLKTRYNLSDDQIKTLRSSGLSNPQLAMAAQLAKSSNKPIDEVLKMRNEQKMGWGKIAKELGVPPREIGHSVRDLRHALRDERKERREERKEKREEKREERKAKMEEKREQRQKGKKQN